MNAREWWRTPRRIAAGMVVAAVAWAPGSALGGGDPTGDYGDAPDFTPPAPHFPTRYATGNSRVGAAGANHTQPTILARDFLGFGLSTEAGATDPSDPDGVPNLVDMDALDDGLVGVMTSPFGAPFAGGPPLTNVSIFVRMTLAAGAPVGPRYVNVLLDVNRDGEWRATGGGVEWVGENVEVEVAPGASAVVQIPLGVLDLSALGPMPEMWLRLTLTRAPIDPGIFSAVGGWDGSGSWVYGETEDYVFMAGPTIVPPPIVPPIVPPLVPPGCDCAFKVRCRPDPLNLLHGVAGTLTWVVKITGSDAAACAAGFAVTSQTTQAYPAPMFGLGVYNGAEAGQVGPAAVGGPVPVPGGVQITITVPINPGTVHAIGMIQSFSVKLRMRANCGGSRVWSATKTCGVNIFHPDEDGDCLSGVLGFGFGSQPIGVPVGVLDGSGNVLGYVVFGDNQPTPGTVRLMRCRGNPACLPQEGTLNGVLPMSWWWSVEYNEQQSPPGGPDVRTQIVGMGLAGYSDATLGPAGLVESQLRPARMPDDAELSQANVLLYTEHVGAGSFVDTAQNVVFIQQPNGFSQWTVGAPGLTVRDCNGNGRPDVADIGTGQAADCYNRAAPPSQGVFVMGGANLVPDSCECRADWNRSGTVEPADVAAYVSSWFFSVQNPGNLGADFNCNGAVSPADVAVYVNEWFASLGNPSAFGC
jgi:hypothetical protein